MTEETQESEKSIVRQESASWPQQEGDPPAMVDLDHSVLSTGQVSNVLGDARQALASQLRTGLPKWSWRRYVK